MKALKSAFLLAACASTLVSCSNNDDVNNDVKNPLEGGYTLIELKANTYAEVEQHYSDDPDLVLTSITTSDYEAEDPTGTLVIDATKFNANKFAYDIKTTVYGKTYSNGELVGESNLPWEMSVPEASSATTYKLIGTDSIFFSGGWVSSPANGNDPQPAVTSGAKYKWETDTLVVTTDFDLKDTSSISQGGTTVTMYSIKRGTQIMRFKKN